MSCKKTFNVQVTLVETKEDCLKKLFKTIRTTRRFCFDNEPV